MQHTRATPQRKQKTSPLKKRTSPLKEERTSPQSVMMQEIKLHIQARYPLIYLVSWEEDRVIAEIRNIAEEADQQKAVYTWTETIGLRSMSLEPEASGKSDPIQILNHIIGASERAIYILLDFHPFLKDHQVIRRVRDAARALKASNKTVIFLSPKLLLPDELSKEIVVFDFDLPSLEELDAALHESLEQAKHDQRIKGIRLKKGQRERLLKASQGLTIDEMKSVLSKAFVAHQKLGEATIPLMLEEKKQIIRKSGVLEYYSPEETFAEIGGVRQLKRWLSKRDKAFTEDARTFGLPVPKGLLLVGVQGCGKSLTAKAVASQWRLPLLRFDLGKVFSGLVGSSEENIRKAVRVAESIAPSILWIDEIEKGLSGSGSSNYSDAGTAARVFGTFVTWLQEKTKPVFVIATANDISQLPPELLRKGRFDEIFFVDLPGPEERQEIFRIHLEKRHRSAEHFDLELAQQSSEGFSGAEIEQVIISALYDAFEHGRPLSTDDILKNLRETVPLSQTMAEHITALREWAKTRARNASGGT
jgi:SpoVK/Ycf46/Vps4 family AAA+-type ATPase